MLVYVVGTKHKDTSYMLPHKAVKTLSEAEEICVTAFKKICLTKFNKTCDDAEVKVHFNLIDEWLVEITSRSLRFGGRYLIRALDLD